MEMKSVFVMLGSSSNNPLVQQLVNGKAGSVTVGSFESRLTLVVLSFFCFRTLLEMVKQEVKLNA
jgi:hypothetical protein